MDCVFITNDDGISNGLESLITYLHNYEIPLLVVVPKINKSASSMAITLREQMRLSKNLKLEEKLNKGKAPLSIFTLSGTPTDCSLFVDFAKGSELLSNLVPIFAISGINHGANLSHDIFHSGTVGAARQTAMNGLPSIASSYCDYLGKDIREAAKLTADLCNNLWNKIKGSGPLENNFYSGKFFLNLNIPHVWNGVLKYSTLGVRDYENALVVKSIESLIESDVSFDGPNIVEEQIEGTDVQHVNSNFASLSLIPTWPHSHKRYPQNNVMEELEKISSIDELNWIIY
jgi:5'/3'-nucleotidase SurE